MFTIRQHGDEWELLDGNGNRVGELHSTYQAALAAMVPILQTMLAEQDAADGAGGEGGDDGLLPETWDSPNGICFSEATGDGRDFTNCTWTARDPNAVLVPLMLQTTYDVGHFGAELAGFATAFRDLTDTPKATGRFYNLEAGRKFRDLLLGGRKFGVSVDAGAYDVEQECVEFDEEGWCVDAVWNFLAYEISGITGTPFPGFANAQIELGSAPAASDSSSSDSTDSGDTSASDDSEEGIAAAASRPALSIPLRPTIDYLTAPEPELGDERLVEQEDGSLAMPLHIGDDGRVMGHVARWGQCHVGFLDECVEPPVSSDGYPGFRVGHVLAAGGEDVATGTLVAGCDHAARHLRAAEARDHYAHNGMAWADVTISNGVFGPWACGVLRPDVTELQLRVLRASSLSGDWREIDGRLELIAALAVNVPGFGIARRALAASGLGDRPDPKGGAYTQDGRVVSLVAAGRVRSCPGCEAARRRETALRATQSDPAASRETLRLLRVIERRTRPMTEQAIVAAAARIRGE